MLLGSSAGYVARLSSDSWRPTAGPEVAVKHVGSCGLTVLLAIGTCQQLGHMYLGRQLDKAGRIVLVADWTAMGQWCENVDSWMGGCQCGGAVEGCLRHGSGAAA